MFVVCWFQCILVLVSVLHVVARYVLQLYEADVAGPGAYYTHLVFDVSMPPTPLLTSRTVCSPSMKTIEKVFASRAY